MNKKAKKKIPVTINLDEDVHEAVMKIVNSRGRGKVSKSLVMADAITFAVMPEYREEREAPLIERLDRLEASFRKHRELTVRDLTILREMIGVWAKVWFTNTPEIPEEHRKAAAKSGAARFEKYMDQLMANLTGENSTTHGLLELADMDDEELEGFMEDNESKD